MRKDLERATPESVGIDSKDIIRFINELEKSGTQMHGLMIVRHGKVITEGWWEPFSSEIIHGCQSLTKTYTSTAIGIAYDEGLLRLEDKIVDIFSELVPEDASEWLKRITVRNALSMGCGIYEKPDLTSEQWLYQYFRLPVTKEPGNTFYYSSATSSLLAAIIKKLTGESLLEYLKPRLFDKIGIRAESLKILKMADGSDNGGGGLFSTTEDNVRLMLLYLNNGIWEGERVLSEEWIKMATSFQNATEEDGGIADCRLGYGFQMWMCRPKGVYRADGAYGQYSIVFPELDMVIGINQSAPIGIWPQAVLDIVWDIFMPCVNKERDLIQENRNAYLQLQEQLNHLTIGYPEKREISKQVWKYDKQRYLLEDNELSIIPSLYHFLTGIPCNGIYEIYFSFEKTSECEMIMVYKEKEYKWKIGLDGTRRINYGLLKECVPQMTACSGKWLDENTLEVVIVYQETCFMKTYLFTFEEEKLTIILNESNITVFNQDLKRTIVHAEKRDKKK